MKQILIITSFFFLIVLFGCNKKLDTVPSDFVVPETFYGPATTATQLTTSLAGVYNTLNSSSVYGQFICLYVNVTTDEATSNSTVSQFDVTYNRYGPTDANITQFWRILYKGIYRANLILDNIDRATSVDSTTRTAVKGEALFLRSYFYYLLVNNYGAVPMPLNSIIDPDNTNLRRMPAKDVYNQLLADMITAEGMVSSIDKIGYGGRVSKSAVQGIIARVCLSMAGEPINDASKYQDALTWTNKVINSGLHSLNPSYSQIFINQCQDKYDIKESIWEVEFYNNRTSVYGTGQGAWGVSLGISCSDINIGNSPGGGYATGKLFKSYTDVNDVRLNWNASNLYYSGSTEMFRTYTQNQYQRWAGKWRRKYETVTPKESLGSPTNAPIIRYADVLLMNAEAEFRVNGSTQAALNRLNEVRTRAQATPFTYTGTGAYVVTDFLQVLQDERSRELCFEGLRKADLVRWGIYVSAIQNVAADYAANAPFVSTGTALTALNTTARNLLYPIPQYELDINTLMYQNPGY